MSRLIARAARLALGSALFAAVFLAPGLRAADNVVENRVQFSVRAERDVANDRIGAVLRVERQAPDVRRLNNTLNALMADAMQAIEGVDSVEVQTSPAGTWPQYDNKTGKLKQWRGSQTIRLESDDFAAAQSLMQALQGEFAIQQVVYSLAPETREDVEDELIQEALIKVQNRAELVSRQMGMSGVRIINLSINPASAPVRHMGREMAMSARADVAVAPTLEGGSGTVTMHINVEIELLP